MLSKDEIIDKDEVLKMANQADAYADAMDVGGKNYIGLRDEYFAKLVAAKEREACANLCWKNKDDNAFINAYNGKRLDLLCADLIKARG